MMEEDVEREPQIGRADPAEVPRSARVTRTSRRRSQASTGQGVRARGGRGSDHDLALKVAMRRLMWRMGCSTRLDVRLRTYVHSEVGRAPAQDLTDLDVLGFAFTPAGQLHTTFADCRSSEKRALERMFWIRGVADFVEADEAYLVRAHDVPPAGRALASRLHVGIVTPDDFAALEATFPTQLDFSGPLACLFNEETVARHLDAQNGADKKLDKLLKYLEFDYWILEPYRNLTQLVAHLKEVVAVLDPNERLHRTLFYDCVWHYSLAVARAAAFVRSTRMGAVPVAVRTYAGGGEQALREKAGLAQLLRTAGVLVDTGLVDPPYLGGLTELVNRYVARPGDTADVLRYAEYLATSEVNRDDATLSAAFGTAVSAIAANLTAVTASFLVNAAGLRPEFRAHARERSVVDLTGGAPRSPEALAKELAEQGGSAPASDRTPTVSDSPASGDPPS